MKLQPHKCTSGGDSLALMQPATLSQVDPIHIETQGVAKILLNLMLHARTRYQENGGQNFVLTITNENSQQLPFTILTRLISSPNISFPHFRSFLILLTVLWIAPRRDSDGHSHYLHPNIFLKSTYSHNFVWGLFLRFLENLFLNYIFSLWNHRNQLVVMKQFNNCPTR